MSASSSLDGEVGWLPTDETSLLDAALAYASHGFRVVPIWGVRPMPDGRCYCGKRTCAGLKSSAGKHPIPREWQKRASTDADVVRDARRLHPNANVGLAMGGPQRLVALDIDGEQGRRSWAELEAGVRVAPRTLTSASGRPDGGAHRIYRVPAHLDIRRLGNRASYKKLGIDTRIDGGQVVVAPSIHVSGARYRWVERAPIADLPEWLFEALAAPIELGRGGPPASARPTPPAAPPSSPGGRVVDFVRPYVAKVIENAAREIAAMREGGRNSLLFAKACTVFEYHVGEGLDHVPAWGALAEAGRSSGLSEAEVSSVLTKAWRKAQSSQGRRVPPPQHADAATATPPAPATPSTPSSTAAADDPAESDDRWKAQLDVNGEMIPKKTLANVITILSCDPRWRGVIAYDAFGDCEVSLKPPPVRDQDRPEDHGAGDWSEEDSSRTVAWLSTEHWLDVPTKVVDQAVSVVARRRVVHPVRDYLSSLTWDGTPRLDRMLATYFMAADTEYSRGISSRWMISAVARIFEPGCQADCTLILESRQHGTGKSTGLEELAGKAWFSSTGLHIGDKDSYQNLRRKWIYELGELVGLRGRELHRYKNFLSERVSNYRASYGRRNKDIPRQCIFAGTTNEDEYLDDRTGNRRFWPVKVRGYLDRDAIRRDRDQLWAEAVARYRAGEPWHVDTPRFRKLCEEEQAQRVQEDPWEAIVSEWLAAPWVTRHDPIDGKFKSVPLDLNAGITTTDVLIGALKMKPGDVDRADQMRIAEVLRALGWERDPVRTRGNDGRTRRWLRSADQPDQPSSRLVQGGWSKNHEQNPDVGSMDQPDQPKSNSEQLKPNVSDKRNSETCFEVGQVGPSAPTTSEYVNDDPEYFSVDDL